MINFALIGAGRWAQNYIKCINVLKDYADILLVCSRNAESYNNLIIRPYGIHHWVSDYKSACKDPRIDAIIIATPPESHYEICKEALTNGKHVICEKPFVFSVKQAIELHFLAESKNLCLVVDYIHLWNKFYQQVKNHKPTQEIKNISFILNNPITFNQQHSVLWDWASHDVSMALHLFSSIPRNLSCIYDDQNILNSRIMALDCEFEDSKCSIWINTNSSKKSRKIIANYKDGSCLCTSDTFEFNPLKELLVDFINALENRIKITNSSLACDVTTVLLAYEK